METRRAVDLLAALAQEARLTVFRLLVQAGPDGLAAGAIAESLAMPAASLSFHLKELRNAGIVEFERRGRLHIYKPDFAAMNELLGFLTENCCSGAAGCKQAGRLLSSPPRPAPGERTPATAKAAAERRRP
jgi:DNA-binding transcriptional ArsR family regulator